MNKAKIIGFAVGPIGAALVGFISLPILAWYFSIEDIGRISMLQVITSFAVIIFSLGLDQAYVREYHESNNRYLLLRGTALPGLIILVFVGFIIFITSPQALSMWLFGINNVNFSIFILVCLLCSFLSRFLSLILRMQERGLAFSMSQLLPKLLFLSVIVFYVLSSALLSFQKLLIAQLLSVIITLLIYSWNTREEWFPALSQNINYFELKGMLQFGFPLVVGGICYWALIAMDRVFLRSFSSFKELGIYSIAASAAAAAGIVSGIFTTIWAPTVFKWAAVNENLNKIDAISEHMLALVYFVLCFSGIFSWIIPYVLPEGYSFVQYLVVACMIAPLFYMVSETTAVGIAISRKTKYSLYASFIAGTINAIGNYLLVPDYGAVGAAISTAVAFWFFVVARTEFSCLVWRKIPRIKLYLTTLLCLSGAVCYALIGSSTDSWLIVMWFVLFIIGFYVFRRSIFSFKLVLINFFSSANRIL